MMSSTSFISIFLVSLLLVASISIFGFGNLIGGLHFNHHHHHHHNNNNNDSNSNIDFDTIWHLFHGFSSTTTSTTSSVVAAVHKQKNKNANKPGASSLTLLPGNNNTKSNTDHHHKRILNIHVVPHTHDDVGWLKTVEQYYYGQNNTIQNACVSCILDSVIQELQSNPTRKFTYVEMAFFSMWWDEQSLETKQLVRKLVTNSQLSFVNGGWCMHDEATTHYMGMIDQTTLGHAFLKRELGYVPTVAWQLDPFGHSSTQASLLGSEAGFNAIYFGRIDYQDLELRQETKNCEGIWDASPNLEDTAIFWGLTGSYKGKDDVHF